MEQLLTFIFALVILYLAANILLKIIASMLATIGIKQGSSGGELSTILFAPLRKAFSSMLAPSHNAMMGGGEARKLLNGFNKGLVIDGDGKRLSPKDSFNHIAVLARTGGGKTTGYIIPNILKLATCDCSMVITDLGGELHQLTSGYLARQGFNVYVLDPESLNETIGYNPLYYALTSIEIDEVVETLLQSSYPGQIRAEDKMWLDGAKTLLFILIKILLATRDHRYINLANLKYLLNNFGSNGKALDHTAFYYLDQRTFSEWKGFVEGNKNTVQSFVTTANTALNAIGINENLARLTAYHSINFERFREEKSVIYIRLPTQKQQQYAFLLNLFYTQFFGVMMKQLPSKSDLSVYCLLDEFGNMKIPNFTSIITTIRKYRVSLSLVLQNFKQIEQKYGQDEAQSIIDGGVTGKLFFAGLDHETTTRLSEMIGEYNVNKIDEFGKTHYQKESILSSSAIRTMQDNEALFFYANKKPLKLTVTPYYKNFQLKSHAKLPPYINSGTFPIERIEFLELLIGLPDVC